MPCRATVCLSLFLSLWLGGAELFAQAEGVSKTSGAAAEAPTPKPSAPESHGLPIAAPFDLRYLEGPDGKPVYVPDKVKLQEFLDWLQERDQREARGPAKAAVTSVSLEGTAEEDRALLTTKVQVQITPVNEWVRVPLGFTEGTLREAGKHVGEGEAIPAAFDAETGHAWWLKGKGTHELTLSLSVPVRKQIPSRRLQLSLPATVVSSLKLRVPFAKVTAKASDKSTLTSRAIGKESELEVIGLGNRLDLTWQPAADIPASDVALETATTISATISDGVSLTLEATQRIQSVAQQGLFEELRVRLPPGLELLRLDGPDYREHRVDAGNLNQVIVNLKKPTAGPIELRWTVGGKLPGPGENFILEGFDVERTRIQTGIVAVAVTGDFRAVPDTDNEKLLQRINLSDLPASLRQSQTAAAYRFINRLKLPLHIERIAPSYSVEPYALLSLWSDHADLEYIAVVQIQRGSVSEMGFRWPDWKKEGWALEGNSTTSKADLRIAEGMPDSSTIRAQLSEPVRGTFDIRLRFRRPINQTSEFGSVSFPLPESAGSSAPLTVQVFVAENIELSLEPAEKTVWRVVPEQAPQRISPSRELLKLRRGIYRIDSLENQLIAQLKTHARQIHTATEVDAAWKNDSFSVRQKLQYDVSYDRLGQLKFRVPAGVAMGRIRFYGAGGTELLPSLGTGTGSAPRTIQIPLETAKIGRFDVEARYVAEAVSPPEAGGGEMAALIVPILQSEDAAWETTRISIRDAGGREANLADDHWVPEIASDGIYVWTRAGTADRVAVSMVPSHKVAGAGQMASRALLRTTIEPGGTWKTRAQYRMPAPATEQHILLPAGSELIGVWWDRKLLNVETKADEQLNATVFVLPAPERTSSERLLTVDFRTPHPAPLRFSEPIALSAVQFAKGLSTAQTHWQVSLPANQHLFTEPANFRPEYHWQRGGVFFNRESDLSPEELSRWIDDASGPPIASLEAGGNLYLFGTGGRPETLSFRVMAQPAIVLIGAGVALVLGLILVKWPITRHVLFVLSVAFLVSLLGMWFTAPVLLLLQPAALGLLLALLAAGIDSFAKRRQRPAVITLGSPSGFVSAPTVGSSHGRTAAVGVGDNEFTSIRAMPAELEPAAGLSESGSRA